jgi:hypothetical protein
MLFFPHLLGFGLIAVICALISSGLGRLATSDDSLATTAKPRRHGPPTSGRWRHKNP